MSSKKMWSCLISGFLAGMSVSIWGVGCSVVLLPALINIGIQQQTALCTSSAITLLASFIMVSMGIINGIYSYIGIAIILIFTIIVVLLTQCIMNKILHGAGLSQYSRNRILYWLFMLSLIFIIIYQLIMYAFNYGQFSSFGYFC